MKSDDEKKQWLDSKQARGELRVSSCALLHMREAGKLRYQKKRNAYLYLKQDIESLRRKRSMQ